MASDSEDDYEKFDIPKVGNEKELARLYEDRPKPRQKSSLSNSGGSEKNQYSSAKVLPPVPLGKILRPSEASGSGVKSPPSPLPKPSKNYRKITPPVQVGKKPSQTPSSMYSSTRASPGIGPKFTTGPKIDIPDLQQRVAPTTLSPKSTDTAAETEDVIYEVMDPQVESVEMTIAEFSTQFSKSLPQQIMVSKGVYGCDDETTLSTSDLCNIHFIRRRELVRVEEKRSRQEYSIPLDSCIKFAPVFNQHDSMEQILKGERFPYVSDLLDLVLMPKVVCACQSYENAASDPVGVVDIREVLAIKGVIHPETPTKPRKLRVYSFSEQCEKELDETVYGHFSTRPSDIKLFMSDILKHVSSPFPMHLIMFRDLSMKSLLGLPPHLFAHPLMMTKKFTEVILIATSALPNSTPAEREPFEIPTDIDVDIQLVRLPKEQQQKLIKDTEELNEKFDSLSIKSYKYENISDEVHRAQSKLYNLVRCKDSQEGVASSEDTQSATTGNKRGLNFRMEYLEKQNIRCRDHQIKVKVQDDSNEQFREFVKTRLKELMTTVSTQSSELQDAKRDVDSLKKQIRALKREVHGGAETEDDEMESGCTSDPEDIQGQSSMVAVEVREKEIKENRKKLADMGQHQLLDLLKRLGLGQYTGTFTKEGITGELLLECDDDLLKNELAVSQKLHRLKIIKLINGKTNIT